MTEHWWQVMPLEEISVDNPQAITWCGKEPPLSGYGSFEIPGDYFERIARLFWLQWIVCPQSRAAMTSRWWRVVAMEHAPIPPCVFADWSGPPLNFDELILSRFVLGRHRCPVESCQTMFMERWTSPLIGGQAAQSHEHGVIMATLAEGGKVKEFQPTVALVDYCFKLTDPANFSWEFWDAVYSMLSEEKRDQKDWRKLRRHLASMHGETYASPAWQILSQQAEISQGEAI